MQARTDSSRLPRKALLPIRGIESAVLGCLRAKNTGLDVHMLTTDRKVDDELVKAASNLAIPYFRGEHRNVLGRFLEATKSYAPDTIVVRLTGDNVFPDGSFITRMIARFVRSGSPIHGSPNYLGLPFGLSAEVFRASELRNAAKLAKTKYEVEHVTPAIWAKSTGEDKIWWPGWTGDFSKLRCSIDDYADYELVLRVFADSPDPILEPHYHLILRLQQLLREIRQ